jgi:large subunit ribosomal protein L18
MNLGKTSKQRLNRRRRRIRKRTFGMPDRPRLSVYRSARHIYAQIIDDLAGRTLASASTMERDGRTDNGGNCAAATSVGTRLAERAKETGIETVVFDRGGRRYHGRVKALAEAARKGGLRF